MEKIPKQEYTTEFKERAVKHVKEGKSIGLSAKELGLVEQTLRNWVKLSAAGKLTGVGAKPVTQEQMDLSRLPLSPRMHYNMALMLQKIEKVVAPSLTPDALQ